MKEERNGRRVIKEGGWRRKEGIIEGRNQLLKEGRKEGRHY
jgi:hypothetical protein